MMDAFALAIGNIADQKTLRTELLELLAVGPSSSAELANQVVSRTDGGRAIMYELAILRKDGLVEIIDHEMSEQLRREVAVYALTEAGRRYLDGQAQMEAQAEGDVTVEATASTSLVPPDIDVRAERVATVNMQRDTVQENRAGWPRSGTDLYAWIAAIEADGSLTTMEIVDLFNVTAQVVNTGLKRYRNKGLLVLEKRPNPNGGKAHNAWAINAEFKPSEKTEREFVINHKARAAALGVKGVISGRRAMATQPPLVGTTGERIEPGVAVATVPEAVQEAPAAHESGTTEPLALVSDTFCLWQDGTVDLHFDGGTLRLEPAAAEQLHLLLDGIHLRTH